MEWRLLLSRVHLFSALAQVESHLSSCSCSCQNTTDSTEHSVYIIVYTLWYWVLDSHYMSTLSALKHALMLSNMSVVSINKCSCLDEVLLTFPIFIVNTQVVETNYSFLPQSWAIELQYCTFVWVAGFWYWSFERIYSQ